MKVTLVSLRAYWKAYLDRKRGLSNEDGHPVTLTDVQDISRDETVGTPKIEIQDMVRTMLNDFKDEIIETLREDMENIEKRSFRNKEKIKAT